MISWTMQLFLKISANTKAMPVNVFCIY